ncbi:MAG: 30S ribosomal protein S18 [Candidatus Cloacimonadota bacterium]|nr:30S ribosomal protein S18 [Candidatus Cloacimonadota bacterium]
MAYNKYSKRRIFRKRVCRFCKNKDLKIDYKDVDLMRKFIAENGKIEPRRVTGTCAKHQRKVAIEIKKAREMALLAYVDN